MRNNLGFLCFLNSGMFFLIFLLSFIVVIQTKQEVEFNLVLILTLFLLLTIVNFVYGVLLYIDYTPNRMEETK